MTIATMIGNMLKPYQPMSNLERQRDFAARNPGYYAKRKRIERGSKEATARALIAAAQAKHAADASEQTCEAGGQLLLPFGT